jgi:hypothetical protein
MMMNDIVHGNKLHNCTLSIHTRSHRCVIKKTRIWDNTMRQFANLQVCTLLTRQTSNNIYHVITEKIHTPIDTKIY